jgi:hypothetical protein
VFAVRGVLAPRTWVARIRDQVFVRVHVGESLLPRHGRTFAHEIAARVDHACVAHELKIVGGIDRGSIIAPANPELRQQDVHRRIQPGVDPAQQRLPVRVVEEAASRVAFHKPTVRLVQEPQIRHHPLARTRRIPVPVVASRAVAIAHAIPRQVNRGTVSDEGAVEAVVRQCVAASGRVKRTARHRQHRRVNGRDQG